MTGTRRPLGHQDGRFLALRARHTVPPGPPAAEPMVTARLSARAKTQDEYAPAIARRRGDGRADRLQARRSGSATPSAALPRAELPIARAATLRGPPFEPRGATPNRFLPLRLGHAEHVRDRVLPE